MQLIRCNNPLAHNITLEETTMSEMDTKGWTIKSFHGSDGNWYEKATHEDGRTRWFWLEEDD